MPKHGESCWIEEKESSAGSCPVGRGVREMGEFGQEPAGTRRCPGPAPGPWVRGKAGPTSGTPMSAPRVQICGAARQRRRERGWVPEPSSSTWLRCFTLLFLGVVPFPSCPDLASLPPSRPSERRRGPRDLQLPGQSPGAAEKAAQSPHRLHRPSAGSAGAQLREAEIPERAGQDGAGRVPQPHRHAGENVVPEQKVKTHPSLLPTALGSHPALLPGPAPPDQAGLLHPTTTRSALLAAGEVRSPPLSSPSRGLFIPKWRKSDTERQGRFGVGWGSNVCPSAPAMRGGKSGFSS